MTTTLDEFHFPVSMQLLQRVGTMAGAAHLNLINLDPDALIKAAEKQTGLHDWGDPAFLRDYRVLMSAVADQKQLSVMGEFSLRNEMLRVLTVWLQMQALLAARPEITQTRIHRPLFIVGLPRTGTTLLHRLFQCDTTHRVAPCGSFERHSRSIPVQRLRVFLTFKRASKPPKPLNAGRKKRSR